MLDFYCFHSSGPTNHFLSSEAPAHLTSAILHAGLEEGSRIVAMKSLHGRVTLLLLLAILPLGMATFVSFILYCCNAFFNWFVLMSLFSVSFSVAFDAPSMHYKARADMSIFFFNEKRKK